MKRQLAVVIFCIYSILVFYSDEGLAKSLSPSEQVEREINNAINKKLTEGRELIRAGIDLYTREKYDEAIEKFLQAREIASIPICCYYLGASYYEKGDKRKALVYFDEAISLFYQGKQERNFNKVFLILTYTYKSHIAYDAGKYREALKNCQQAISYADDKEIKKLLKDIEASIIVKERISPSLK